MRYASTRRVLYQVSVGTALLGALLSMAPYYMMARVVKKLLSGESSFSAYQMDFILGALLDAPDSAPLYFHILLSQGDLLRPWKYPKGPL